MRGPSEPGKDADIERLLASEFPEDVRDGIQLSIERYIKPMYGYLRHDFPGLTPQEKLDVVEGAVGELAYKYQAGIFEPKGNIAPLLFNIVKYDAIDCLRRKSRRFVDGFDLDKLRGRRPDPRMLRELELAIDEFIEKELEPVEKIALQVFARLIRFGDATQTGRIATELLAKEVNQELRKLGMEEMSPLAIVAARDRARDKLQRFLVLKGFVDE